MGKSSEAKDCKNKEGTNQKTNRWTNGQMESLHMCREPHFAGLSIYQSICQLVCPFICPYIIPSVSLSITLYFFFWFFFFCSLWAHSPCQNNQGTSNMAPPHPLLIEVVLVYPAFVGHRTRPSGPQVSALKPDFVPQSLSCSASNPQLCLQELKLALQT